MESITNIGRNIAFFRERHGLTQDDLADYLKLSNHTLISYYETGARTVPIDHLNKMADLFGVEVNVLLEESPEVAAANIAFAFKTDGLSPEDLNSISFCKKIVLNYLKMEKLLKK
jgi:transcriptional regulator with XRE-family HTH domain